MKPITNLPCFAVTVAFALSSAAIADDQQLQNRLALERARVAKTRITATTSAPGVTNRAAAHAEAQTASAQWRFKLRRDAHGQTFGTYVPSNK